MIIKGLNTIILNIDDKEMKDGDKDLTLKRAIIVALGNRVATDSDPSFSNKDAEHITDLAMRFKAAGDEIEIESEDSGMIKARIRQCYSPFLAGQTMKLIEGKSLSGSLVRLPNNLN